MAKTREKALISERAYRARREADPELKAAHLEKRRARERAAYDADPEKFKAKNKKYWDKHPEMVKVYNDRAKERGPKKRYPESDRAYHLKKKYGITVEDYDRMFQEQQYGCAVCGTEHPDYSGRQKFFHVDHDHASGKVRGLLCKNCNIALGHVRDDLDVVLSMAVYLMQSENVLSHLIEGDVYHR